MGQEQGECVACGEWENLDSNGVCPQCKDDIKDVYKHINAEYEKDISDIEEEQKEKKPKTGLFI